MAGVKLMRAQDRTRHTAQTPGMVREEAFKDSAMWSGYVRTAPGMISGWHHHGDYETVIYVVTGSIRIESGAEGREVADAQPGDFILVPKHAIHRESNPSNQECGVVVIRVGTGAPVTNVDAPLQA